MARNIGLELVRELRSIQKKLDELRVLARSDPEFVFAVENMSEAQDQVCSALYEVRCTLDDEAIADYGVGCN